MFPLLAYIIRIQQRRGAKKTNVNPVFIILFSESSSNSLHRQIPYWVPDSCPVSREILWRCGPEGSLPRLQDPATCLYPELNKFNPHLISTRSFLILCCCVRAFLLNGLFISGFATNDVDAFWSLHLCFRPRLPHIPWSDNPIEVFVEEYKLWSSSLRILRQSPVTFSYRYYPWQSLLLLPVFFL